MVTAYYGYQFYLGSRVCACGLHEGLAASESFGF